MDIFHAEIIMCLCRELQVQENNDHITSHGHPGLAEVAAGSVAGLAEVVPCIRL